jgi:hypothetical protein
MSAVIIIKHSENSSNAVAKEILFRSHNIVRQRLNLFVKPLYYFTNSATLSQVGQGFHPDLINLCLQVSTKLAKLLAMAHPILLEFCMNSCNFIHSFSLFKPERIDGSAEACTLFFFT